MALMLLDIPANALCLALMLRLTGRRIRPWRTVLAALLGAVCAQGVRMLGPSRTQAALLWLPLACLLAAAAGGGRWLRAGPVLLACYGLVGGTVTALAGATGSLLAAWGTGAAAVLAMAVCAMRARCAAGDVHTVRVRVIYAGRTADFCAMVDSGNSLRDYLTHRPVMVLPEAAGRRLFGRCAAALRPIFADTAGGRQMMGCFTPQRTQVTAAGRTRDVRCVVALSPALRESAPALLPLSLLQPGSGDEEGDAYGNAED